MAIRSTLKTVLVRVAARVGKDGLFEQPGERARAQPLVSASPVVSASHSSSHPSSHPTQSERPATGCRVVGAEDLKKLLVPGSKPLVVNHWATWCEPCVDELPRLVRSHAGIGDKAEVMGISWDLFDNQAPGVDVGQVAKKVAAFADDYGVGYGSVLFAGKPEALFALCGLDLHQVPQTLVLARTREGEVKVVWHHKGILLDEDVFPLIRAATQPF